MTDELTHVCLFSGIGGFSLAAEACGLRTVVFCERDADRQRDLADPFCGGGTTGIAAMQCGRRFEGYEGDPEYAALSKERIGNAHEPLRAFDTPANDQAERQEKRRQ